MNIKFRIGTIGWCAIAKEKPIYEVVAEFSDLANKLISLNDEKFGHLESRTIRMTVITNKEQPLKPPYFKVIRVNNPVASFCAFRFVIISWQQIWDSLSLDQKGLLLLDIFHYLEPDDEEPKLIAPDVKDHSSMLRTFGVDYLNNSTIKGIFEKPIEWSEGGDIDFGSKKGKKAPPHPEVEDVGADDAAFDAGQATDTFEEGDGEEWKKGIADDDGEGWKNGTNKDEE